MPGESSARRVEAPVRVAKPLIAASSGRRAPLIVKRRLSLRLAVVSVPGQKDMFSSPRKIGKGMADQRDYHYHFTDRGLFNIREDVWALLLFGILETALSIAGGPTA